MSVRARPYAVSAWGAAQTTTNNSSRVAMARFHRCGAVSGNETESLLWQAYNSSHGHLQGLHH